MTAKVEYVIATTADVIGSKEQQITVSGTEKEKTNIKAFEHY